MRKIFSYFLRGLLFLFPAGATIILIYLSVKWLDGIFGPLLEKLIGIRIPGIGVLLLIVIILLVGVFVSGFAGRAMNRMLDSAFSNMPLIKIIYTGLKDFSEAFIGEKKKFRKPVMVKMSETGIMKLGFITQDDVCQLGLEGMVAVYFPHSYNFSGNLFLVPTDKIIPVKANPTEMMKFIVSAGVMNIEESVNK